MHILKESGYWDNPQESDQQQVQDAIQFAKDNEQFLEVVIETMEKKIELITMKAELEGKLQDKWFTDRAFQLKDASCDGRINGIVKYCEEVLQRNKKGSTVLLNEYIARESAKIKVGEKYLPKAKKKNEPKKKSARKNKA